MKPVFLVYKTDCHHRHDSRELIGIATDKAIAIRLCKERAKKDGERITAEQIELLTRIKQTQGGSEDDKHTGEFLFEEQPTNELI